ncbi:MAG: ArsC/Spx/MgsR family protein [Meiothermus sp.]|nr:ArsC/Spx/MgsR family protein [Meiothermus sp.]
MEVQIFGLKGSSATRAAERFFKERRIRVHFVDLAQRAMSPAEIGRFVRKFGLDGLIDTAGKPYRDGGLEFMRITSEGWLVRIAAEPRLLRLPLVRAGERLTVGLAEADWKAWAQSPK